MPKNRSNYINEIKEKFDEGDKNALIEAAIRIKELECEYNQLQKKLSEDKKTKESKWTFWNNISYLSTLVIVFSFIVLILYYFIPYKQNIITQQNNQIKTLQQQIKDCNCTHQ
ncbi:hypothetical protein [Sulfurimonas sp.]|uniref:hypothetical protein n=1 Tax=Sulfurimonas sp. TaxID=2022749 RepID=UPI002636829E|nr:hypothetical protein [Sulfurimonas sp.]